MAKPWSRFESLRTDCRHFRGDLPCLPRKRSDVHCVDENGDPCLRYERQTSQVLIIKLGALGDVIRTTPVVRRLRSVYPEARLWWLTLSPDIIATSVDVALPFTAQSLAVLQATAFDILYNFDKDREACALAARLHARMKKDFPLVNGTPAPIDADAQHKYLTAVFDDLSKAKSYRRRFSNWPGLISPVRSIPTRRSPRRRFHGSSRAGSPSSDSIPVAVSGGLPGSGLKRGGSTSPGG